MDHKPNKHFFFILSLFFILINIVQPYLNAQEGNLTVNDNKQKGWATISGILAWVEMDYSESTEWEELALIDSKGETTILIGELVSQLLDKIGKQITVTGVYKPPMKVRGKLIPVLEVRFIDRIQK